MASAAAPTPIERLALRVRRFMRTVRPGLSNLERALAEEWLAPDLLYLFLTQSPADQRHAVNVARLLLRSGHSSHDLICASLLHDAGKRSAAFRPWHRTAIVVLEACAPWALRRLAGHGETGWRGPFAVHLNHASDGASLALDAGATERAAGLVRRHHERSTAGDEELQILIWADDRA
jgi:hypothetical protein